MSEREKGIRRIDAMHAACSGIPTAALEAAGKGGVLALVEAGRTAVVLAQTVVTLAEGMAYTQGEQWEHSAIDETIAECSAAIAPFTADAPEGE